MQNKYLFKLILKNYARLSLPDFSWIYRSYLEFHKSVSAPICYPVLFDEKYDF
jgi:hypothetical protein